VRLDGGLLLIEIRILLLRSERTWYRDSDADRVDFMCGQYGLPGDVHDPCMQLEMGRAGDFASEEPSLTPGEAAPARQP